MDKASGTNEIKQDSFVKWVNQTAIFAGLIGGACMLQPRCWEVIYSLLSVLTHSTLPPRA
jgi:hypothetical protein